MSQSITASNSGVPYTLPILQDNGYNVSTTIPTQGNTGSTAALYFPNVEFPTTGKIIVQLSNTTIYNVSGSGIIKINLQESSDNITWNNIAIFANPLLGPADSANTASAGTVSVHLSPTTALPYLRAQAMMPNPSTGSLVYKATGSFGINTFFTA